MLAVAAAEALPLAIGACLRETIDHVLPAGPVALEIPMTVRMRF